MAQIKTLRKIAKRMGWSPAKVLRRHKLDDFPLYPDWTKRGPIWATSDELILLWEQNKVRMNQGARLRPPPRPRRKPSYHPYNWRLRYKNETPSRTIGPAPVEEKRRQPIHEEPPKPMTREELDNLGPIERAWVINHELTPAQREELGVKLAENVIPEGCTCGTETPCSVCQG